MLLSHLLKDMCSMRCQLFLNKKKKRFGKVKLKSIFALPYDK